MSPYLIFGATMFVLVFNTLYWQVVRPARKRSREVRNEPKPVATAELRVPRDTSRTYPRPGRTRSKLTRVCPVCGMEDPGNLDGKVLGWPAHRSCAEWLGDWRPAPTWQSGIANTIIFTGKGPVVAHGGGAGGSSASSPERNICDGCHAPLGTGVRYHDAAGHHYCPACDRKGCGRDPGPIEVA